MIRITPHDFYLQISRNMPPGIERAIIQVLADHVGKDNSIDKKNLCQQVQQALVEFARLENRKYRMLAYSTIERQIRDCIADMDNDQVNDFLIVSSTGNGGYFLCATWDEYSEFWNVENSRKNEIERRLEATRAKAERLLQQGLPATVFENAKQASLFGD